MQKATESNVESIPVGDLGIVALESCSELGRKINDHIVSWRRERDHIHAGAPVLHRYTQDSFLVPVRTPRFGSGEAKGQIFGSVRGDDLYLLVDVCNHSITYTMNGVVNHMSPDDHFQDLKRVIAAIGGKARRITVIMPFLYESRQHKRTGRESLDCAMGLQELIHTPKRRRASASSEGTLTIMARNFDATKFIDSQLIPGTEEHFHGTDLAGQARWMYRTLLRGAVIARKAEFELSEMQTLRRKLESSAKANNDFKVQVELLQSQLSEMGEKLKASEEKMTSAEEKLKASDET